MTTLREEMSQDLQIAGLGKRTHDGYLREVGFQLVKMAVWFYLGWVYWLASGCVPPGKREPRVAKCAECGGRMFFVCLNFEPCAALMKRSALPEHDRKYLDSG